MGTLKMLPFWALAFMLLLHASEAAYKVGVGRADCTGPTAEIVFMGYAKSGQKGCGLHLRQFSRAYIIDDGSKRAAFVSVDAAMMGLGVRKEVLKNLAELYDDTYNENNVIISGTHTHGAPGGFLMDVMLDISVLGFVQQTFDALVSGITKSIARAHENMVDARIFINSGELLEANINRSPQSYLKNPKEERANYDYNVDKDLVQMKFVRTEDDVPIGAINWFAVHPTSMNNSNCLVTSDNVGYASILLEKSVNPDALIGKGDFVGAFASTNLGDVSPNLKGPHCINTGEPCDTTSSTCDGEAKYCIAFGPGNDMFESTEIIATRLFNKARELFDGSDATEVSGPVKYIHQYVDMPTQTATITLANGTEQEVKGCLPGMGYSFAAGTTDGPGEFDFTQGSTSSNPFWNVVRDFIFPPTDEDQECHGAKPVLIMSGRIKLPYEWQPEVVSTQMFQIGNVFFTAVPGEFTTMSGRRLRNTVKNTIIENGGPENTRVVITGLSNIYTNYIATPEEYQLQRYEGASTIYGPHTLTIYLKLYNNLAASLVTDKAVQAGPPPAEFPDNLLTLVTPVLFDTAGFSGDFGDCTEEPPSTVKIGDTVTVKFIAGHPRNDLMTEKTFLTVEKQDGDDWTVVATDANWETRFTWKRLSFIKGSSEVKIRWDIRDHVQPGTYRIRHFGHYKFILGGIYAYEGATNTFRVVA
ncbi:neutral ceramidase isoform X2 [Anoplophora glabripennis]|uniref:neutral ceramidase isoform X2 n=1 Tax=Anoplophora glabripennis TaxID=217634 RepID=UPI000873A98E|nr:neutral ceramidase isoform X2 [Anoplophora glabripennis]